MIHYSLFPNDKCTVCNKKVLDNALHCKKCEKKWLNFSESKGSDSSGLDIELKNK